MIRILFIGNSFTNRNDLPGMLTRLGASADPPVVIETARVVANGVSLKTHWDRGEALKVIRDGPVGLEARSEDLGQPTGWDFVSLQDQSTMGVKNPGRLQEYVERFDEEIRKAGATTVLYLTWARQSVPETQNSITEAYSGIGKKLGALVIPVGVAWQKVLKEHPEIPLYDRDGSHPSPAGSYLAACLFYACLTGCRAVGLASDVPGVSDAAARVLQQAASDGWGDKVTT